MANYKWNLQLTSPTGEVFELGDMGDMGRASRTQEHGYIFGGIIKFLEESNLAQREFVLSDLSQMLLNSGFHRYHGYRLAWGGGSHEEDNGYRLAWGGGSHEEGFSGYPDGVALDWQFYRLINGKAKLLLEGALPSNWWEIDQDDRDHLVEEKIRDEGWEASAA